MLAQLSHPPPPTASYHVTSFEDPIEGKVPVGLAKGSSDPRGGGVIQGGPPQLVEPGEPVPLERLHPLLLTCKR